MHVHHCWFNSPSHCAAGSADPNSTLLTSFDTPHSSPRDFQSSTERMYARALAPSPYLPHVSFCKVVVDVSSFVVELSLRTNPSDETRDSITCYECNRETIPRIGLDLVQSTMVDQSVSVCLTIAPSFGAALCFRRLRHWWWLLTGWCSSGCRSRSGRGFCRGFCHSCGFCRWCCGLYGWWSRRLRSSGCRGLRCWFCRLFGWRRLPWLPM